jgi:hypothetical protein
MQGWTTLLYVLNNYLLRDIERSPLSLVLQAPSKSIFKGDMRGDKGSENHPKKL